MRNGVRRLALGMAASLTLLVLPGCAGLRLYPVQGPLSALTPPPVYSGKIVASGKSFTFALGDNEVCAGKWVYHESKDLTPEQLTGLHAAWDTIYGPGFYTAHVLGVSQLASGTGSTAKGTKLAMEFVFPAENGAGGPDRVHGVAVDNQGNVFKLTLRAPGDKSA